MWREDGVFRILKNDKYVGDLIQWKHYSTDFLSKKVLQNNGDNPDVLLISIVNHHEGIISCEVWDLAQQQVLERGKNVARGRSLCVNIRKCSFHIYAMCDDFPFIRKRQA